MLERRRISPSEPFRFGSGITPIGVISIAALCLIALALTLGVCTVNKYGVDFITRQASSR
jgi:hypothetical protein